MSSVPATPFVGLCATCVPTLSTWRTPLAPSPSLPKYRSATRSDRCGCRPRHGAVRAAGSCTVRPRIQPAHLRLPRHRAAGERLERFYVAVAEHEAAERAEAERLAAERAEAERIEAERTAARQAAAQRAPQSRMSGGWAALRNCESGGNYRAVSSSGAYRGAYQFSRATWNSVAARSRPHLVGVDPAAASPADQDAMALALHASAGSSPWPKCGRHL
jgi:hypothetical protein